MTARPTCAVRAHPQGHDHRGELSHRARLLPDRFGEARRCGSGLQRGPHAPRRAITRSAAGRRRGGAARAPGLLPRTYAQPARTHPLDPHIERNAARRRRPDALIARRAHRGSSPPRPRWSPYPVGALVVSEGPTSTGLLPEREARVNVSLVEPVLRDHVLLVETAGDYAAANANGVGEIADVRCRPQRRHPR